MLELASDRLKNDKEIVLAALGAYLSEQAIEHIGKKLHNDFEVALAVAKINPWCLKDFPALLDNEEVIREAIKNIPSSIKLASNRVQNKLAHEDKY